MPASRRFVYVSSLGADRGESPYHRSKLRGEEVARTFDGNWIIVRPGNVYGNGDEQLSLILKMVRIPSGGSGDRRRRPAVPAHLGRRRRRGARARGGARRSRRSRARDCGSRADDVRRRGRAPRAHHQARSDSPSRFRCRSRRWRCVQRTRSARTCRWTADSSRCSAKGTS